MIVDPEVKGEAKSFLPADQQPYMGCHGNNVYHRGLRLYIASRAKRSKVVDCQLTNQIPDLHYPTIPYNTLQYLHYPIVVTNTVI